MQIFFLVADKFVDLVTDKSLSNPYFIESVNQIKVLVYG